MLKLSENPPVLSASVERLAQLDGQWWVAHTKARAEKALAWDLHRLGIGYFLPMIERVKVSGGRKRHVLLPLFPSYIFMCGSGDDRYAAMTTNRIAQVLDIPDQAGFVRELTAIERALQADALLDPYPQVARGKRCRISAGPFAGVEGIVVRTCGKARFVIQVDFIGQGAAMEVDADLLEEL
jgi:transcription antitermination factor NusG